MRSSAWSVIALLALTAAACAQGEEQGDELPADMCWMCGIGGVLVVLLGIAVVAVAVWAALKLLRREPRSED